nr:hypothetical protein [Burkholderiales bacterium]
VLAMEAQGSAANAADTAYFLALDSIALARGAAPSRGLGIRLAETGEVIRVIPEASTWAAMLAGLLVAAVLGRRRAA